MEGRMTVKKLIATLLALCMLLSLCAPFVLTIALTVKKRWLHGVLYAVSFALLILYLTAVVGGYTIYGTGI